MDYMNNVRLTSDHLSVLICFVWDKLYNISPFPCHSMVTLVSLNGDTLHNGLSCSLFLQRLIIIISSSSSIILIIVTFSFFTNCLSASLLGFSYPPQYQSLFPRNEIEKVSFRTNHSFIFQLLNFNLGSGCFLQPELWRCFPSRSVWSALIHPAGQSILIQFGDFRSKEIEWKKTGRQPRLIILTREPGLDLRQAAANGSSWRLCCMLLNLSLPNLITPQPPPSVGHHPNIKHREEKPLLNNFVRRELHPSTQSLVGWLNIALLSKIKQFRCGFKVPTCFCQSFKIAFWRRKSDDDILSPLQGMFYFLMP